MVVDTSEATVLGGAVWGGVMPRRIAIPITVTFMAKEGSTLLCFLCSCGWTLGVIEGISRPYITLSLPFPFPFPFLSSRFRMRHSPPVTDPFPRISNHVVQPETVLGRKTAHWRQELEPIVLRVITRKHPMENVGSMYSRRLGNIAVCNDTTDER